LTKFAGKRIVKIGQYLAKIWTRKLLTFWPTLYMLHFIIHVPAKIRASWFIVSDTFYSRQFVQYY